MQRLAVIGAGLLSIAGLAEAASAADLPAQTYTKAPVIVDSVYNWTGFYIGIEGGGGWGRSQHYRNDPLASPTTVGLPLTRGINPSGGLAGGTVGYNYQFSNNIVIGLENDISWTDIKGGARLAPPFNGAEAFHTNQTWLDTLRGRVGYAWDRWMVFGSAGAAFTNEDLQFCNAPTFTGCLGQSKTVTGWTAGAGVEYAFAANWSAKVEYLHTDFGSQFFPRRPGPGGGFFAARNVTLIDDIARIGVNYKFGSGAAVIAKY
jgi:outer membrane immunogenic protein